VLCYRGRGETGCLALQFHGEAGCLDLQCTAAMLSATLLSHLLCPQTDTLLQLVVRSSSEPLGWEASTFPHLSYFTHKGRTHTKLPEGCLKVCAKMVDI